MTAWSRRQRSRAIGVSALGFAALVHLLALQLLLTGRAPAPAVAEEPAPIPPVVLEIPAPRPAPAPRPVRDRKHRRIEEASAKAPARTPTPERPALVRPAARALATLTPHVPTAPGPGQAVAAPSGAISGIQWGEEGGVREALRVGPGCDFEDLKLSKVERERCNEHAARQAKKGPVFGPAADDPKRAAQLAADADYNRRINHWKSGYGESGNAKCLQAVVGAHRPGYGDVPPTPGGPAQPPDDPCN